MSRRTELQVDPYEPPSRAAEGALVEEEGDESQAPHAVVFAMQKGRPVALTLAGAGALCGLLFGLCGLSLVMREGSVGGGLYFLGLATACAVPAGFFWRVARLVQDLGVIPTTGKLVQVVEAQHRAWRAAAIAFLLAVGVTGVLLVVLLSGPKWD